MKIHFVGKVFEFHKDPAQVEMYVEVPLFEQANAPIELLVQLDKADVDPEAAHRLGKFEKLDPDLQAVIRKNSGLPVEGQIQLVDEISKSLRRYYPHLRWKTYPKYDDLKTVIELCWRFLLKKSDSRASVRSPAQLAYMTLQYTQGRTIKSLIAASVESEYWNRQEPEYEKRVQRVVLLILGVFRQWFDFKLPKLLIGVSELQEYVFKRAELEPGNYSYLSALLENQFFEGNLSILMDYDIPASAVRKLEGLFSGQESWQAIENRLRTVDLKKMGLLDYEVKKLKSALGS